MVYYYIAKIIILDIAFESIDDLNKCRNNNQEDWESSEYYIVWELLKKLLPDFEYKQLSTCVLTHQ